MAIKKSNAVKKDSKVVNKMSNEKEVKVNNEEETLKKVTIRKTDEEVKKDINKTVEEFYGEEKFNKRPEDKKKNDKKKEEIKLTDEEEDKILEFFSIMKGMNKKYEKFSKLLDENISSNNLDTLISEKTKDSMRKEFSQPLDDSLESKKLLIKFFLKMFLKKLFSNISEKDFLFIKETINKRLVDKEEDLDKESESYLELISKCKNKSEYNSKLIEEVIKEITEEIENDDDTNYNLLKNYINTELFPVDGKEKVRELLQEYPNYETTINYVISKIEEKLGITNTQIMVKNDFSPSGLIKTKAKWKIEDKLDVYETEDEELEAHEGMEDILYELRRKCTNMDNEKVKEFFELFYITSKEFYEGENKEEEKENEN